jgi:hypothetical protein
MKKLTKNQIKMLWGDDKPYSEVGLIKQNRILGGSVSRIFIIVKANINPTTFEIILDNRNNPEFKEDKFIQDLLDNSVFEDVGSGYITHAFEHEYIDENIMMTAEIVLEKAQESLIKMHNFIINNYDIPQFKINFGKNKSKTPKVILDIRKEIEVDIADLLEEVNSDFTLDDVKKAIFLEKESADMQKIIAMFDTGEPDTISLSTVIETITDAWNYFPHKALDGLCPQELSELYENGGFNQK